MRTSGKTTKANNPTAPGQKAADIAHYTRLAVAGHKWSVKKRGRRRARFAWCFLPGAGRGGIKDATTAMRVTEKRPERQQ